MARLGGGLGGSFREEGRVVRRGDSMPGDQGAHRGGGDALHARHHQQRVARAAGELRGEAGEMALARDLLLEADPQGGGVVRKDARGYRQVGLQPVPHGMPGLPGSAMARAEVQIHDVNQQQARQNSFLACLRKKVKPLVKFPVRIYRPHPGGKEGTMADKVADHYAGGTDITGAIAESLRKAGKDPGTLTTADLGTVDEFHIRGRQATLELAPGAEPLAQSHVLDIGSGLGGPARTIAETHGCHVTGIDLTQAFCDAASALEQLGGPRRPCLLPPGRCHGPALCRRQLRCRDDHPRHHEHSPARTSSMPRRAAC